MGIETLFPYAVSGGMAVMRCLCAIAVRILSKLSCDVAELNNKMAVIMNELAHASSRFDKVEDRLDQVTDRLRALEVSQSH